MARRPKTSYRLGRRLKAGAKARLDYITYLQSGSDKRNRRPPEVPGRVSMRFALGGTMVADIAAFTRQFIGAVFEGGGDYANRVAIRQELSFDYPGGGNFRMNIYPPITLAATMSGGGSFKVNGHTPQFIGAVMNGGGELTTNIGNPMVVGAVMQGGGAMTTRVQIEVPLTDWATEVIAAMDTTPSVGRQMLINDLCDTLETNGLRAKIKYMNVYAAHAQQAALIDWTDPNSDATLISSPIFTADVGFMSAGVTSVIDTNYNLTGLTTNLGVTFKCDEPTAPSVDVGLGLVSLGSATTVRLLFNGTNGNFVANITATSGDFALPSDYSSVFTAQRNGGDVEGYEDGVLIFDSPTTMNSGTIPATTDFYALAYQQEGSTPTAYMTDRNQQFLVIHDTLTAGEVTILHNALNAYIAGVTP